MTVETIRVWTCNVCRASVETEPTKQPAGWVGYGFTEPDIPAASPDDNIGHLCEVCAARVKCAMVGQEGPTQQTEPTAKSADLACAWSDYRKDYGVRESDSTVAHKAFTAGWRAARKGDQAGALR